MPTTDSDVFIAQNWKMIHLTKESGLYEGRTRDCLMLVCY